MQIIQRLLNGTAEAQARAGGQALRVVAGPLLTDLTAQPAHRLAEYRGAGGYELAARVARSRDHAAVCETLEEAGLRGRAGGGFPTGHKWHLVARSEAPEKYFVCNANAGPGDMKVSYILGAAPHKVIEAVCVGALTVGASVAYLAIPAALAEIHQMFEAALAEVTEAGLLGEDAFGSGRALELRLVSLPPVYIVGEETALLEHIEGRPPRPRGKPPLPTSRGLHGAPTVVSNIETVLHAAWVLRHGAAAFRSQGAEYAPGTLVFSVSGDVERPGLYELPLGTSLAKLVNELAGGVRGRGRAKLVFPGGLASVPVAGPALDVALEYDVLKELGSELGSGTILVVAEDTSAVDLAIELGRLFHESSCGKCQPCKDGTQRTLVMLERLEEIHKPGIDVSDRSMPPTKRRVSLRVVNAPSTAPSDISYTHWSEGLDKIDVLCQFYKHRGDCHHSHEAASVIQSLLERFRPEFEARHERPAGDAP